MRRGGVVLGGLGIVGFVAGLALLPNLGGGVLMLVGAIVGLAGLQLLALGIIGEYVWRALEESRRRPPCTRSRPAPVTGTAEPAGRLTLMSSADYRPRIILTVAVLLFAVVATYRFNTLGGALGGFDNDHFLHFVLAKQVQAGEQPIRDFLDAGLQGARPSLTYELSALAQSVFGDNFRSEALLTVAGVAAGAAAAFVAGSALAPWPIALAMAVLSALVSPKLYGYRRC